MDNEYFDIRDTVFRDPDEILDVDCTIVKSPIFDDWYVLERVNHDGKEWLERRSDDGSMSYQRSARINEADVEGLSGEWRSIETAIRSRGRVSFKRCEAVHAGPYFLVHSPRNSHSATRLSVRAADFLADQIAKVLGDEVRDSPDPG